MKHSPASFTAAIFVISILLCAPLFGQTLTAAYSLADNTPYCHGTSYSCLTSIGGVMTEIKTGADGTVYGLNSSHALYTYTHAAGWVLAAANLQNPGGLSIVHISVGSKTQVMALSSAASQNHNVYVLDASGTTWLPLGAWLSPNAAEIGSDGTVWGMNSGGTGRAYINGAWAGRGGALANIAVGSADIAWGVTSAGILEVWNGSAFVQAYTRPPFVGASPSTAKNAIAVVGEASLALLDNHGVIRIRVPTGFSSVVGTASAITGAGADMFVLKSTGVSYHVNLLAPAVTITANNGETLPAQAAHPAVGAPRIP